MDKNIKLGSLIKNYFAAEESKEEVFNSPGVRYSIMQCQYSIGEPAVKEPVRDICSELKKAAEEDPASLPEMIKTYKDHIKTCPACAEIAEAAKAWEESKNA